MKNKIIVITGGASGIGFAIAKELIEQNTIVSIDRNLSKIEVLKNKLPKVISLRADITINDEVDNVLKEIERNYGKIDILINNAGKGGGFDFINMSESVLKTNIETELSINYIAPVMLIKKTLALLKKSAQPIVVVCSTGLVYMPMAALGSYCASKAAVHFITLSIRHLLKPLNIKVVEVLPPSVDTDLNIAKGVSKMSPEAFAKVFIKKLSKGEEVINIGQSASLEKFSRLFPKMAFRMLNKG